MKNKKSKWAIPAAVLALSCGSMVALTACSNCGGDPEGPPAHTHEYTEWVNTDPDEHWKICPEDGEIGEDTRAPHDFDDDGNCECGAKGEAAVYGTVKGEVKLFKKGAYVTDFTGLKVDIDDDDVTVKTSSADGKFTYSISDVKVGKEYTLSITKAGYKPYTTTVELESENQEFVIGGDKGKTLEYEVFRLMMGWDSAQHDFSHVNDAENPYVCFRAYTGDPKTLNILTNDSYEGNLSASMKVKFDNSTNNMRTQGIVLKFEDGKHLIVRYHNGDVGNGNIQYCNDAWGGATGGLAAANTLFGDDAKNATDKEGDPWRYGEYKIHDLTASEGAKIKSDGADLQLILKDGALYTFFDGKYIEKYELPEGYDKKKVQVGYYIFDTASNAVFNYDIGTEVPAEMKTTLDIDVTKPDEATDCAVTASPVKEKYEFGEKIKLSIAVQEGYLLQALTVNGEDMFKAAGSGEITVTADRPTLEVKATFVKEEPIALDLTVKGKRLGKTENLPKGTVVQFEGIDTPFTVGDNGKITGQNVVKTRYTVSVDKYLSQEIEFDEKLKEIVFEYDTFKNIITDTSWGATVDFGRQNDATTVLGSYGDCSAVFTNDTYGKVKTSIYLKGENMTQGEAGLTFRFVGDGLNAKGETVTVLLQQDEEGNKKVQFNTSNLWGYTTVADGYDYTDKYFFQDKYDGKDYEKGANAEKYLEEFNAGTLKLSVMRDGATFYVFLDDTLIGQETMNAKYTDKNCEVGFYSASINSKGSVKNWKVEIDDNPVLAKATLTDETAKEGAHGSLTLPTGELKVGDTVEIVIVPETTESAKYKLKSLTVGGVDVTAQVVDLKYKFIIGGDTVVKATFEEIVEGDINCGISGKKLGIEGNSIKIGDKVTLSAPGLPVINTEVSEGAEGAIVINEIGVPVGTYTVTVEGYITATITVEKNQTYSMAIALEYDMFYAYQNWGTWDFSEQNEGKISMTNGLEMMFTKDTYDEVAFSVLLGEKQSGKQGNQGIAFRFGDDIATIKMENKDKVQVLGETYADWYVPKANIAAGSKLPDGSWHDLIFLTGDNADANAQTYLKHYDARTLKLTCVRKGAMVFVFLDDTYVGMHTFDTKYADVKASVGFSIQGLEDDVDKTWTVAFEDIAKYNDLAITNETATDANGTVRLDKSSYTLGDTVNLTIAANSDYKLQKLEVGGVDVTSSVTGGTSYSFVAVVDATVKATFEAIGQRSSVNAEIVAKKLGVGNALKAGDTVILKSHTVPYITATVTAGEAGKLLLTAENVPTGEYTISEEGYFPINITVGATAYSEAIVLDYDSFYASQGWGNWNFSGQNGDSGMIVATNEAEAAFTKETFDDVAFSVLLKKFEDDKDGNLGIAFRFGNDLMSVRMENTTKIQFAEKEWVVKDGENAAGSGYQDVIFFKTTADGTADANAQTYLQEYEAGTLKLTCVRKGATVYVFLDGKYIGSRTFDAKYIGQKASVGFYYTGLSNDTDKDWTVTLEKDISSYLDKVTAYGWSKVTMPESETDLTGTQITLTDRDDNSKTYNVELKKSDERGYYFEGNFRPGHYELTMTGYTCTAAGKDEQGVDTTQLWIDSEGGQLYGVTFAAEATGGEGGETGEEEVTPEA